MAPSEILRRIPLFTEGSSDSDQQAAARDVRKLLSTIQSTRRGVSFQLVPQEHEDFNPSEDRVAISCGYRKIDEQADKLGATVRTCRLCIPPGWQASEDTEGAELLDIRLIFVDSALDNTAESPTEIPSNDHLQHLIATYAASAKWEAESEQTLLAIHQRTTQDSDRKQTLVQAQAAARSHASIEQVAVQDLLELFGERLDALNGLILADNRAAAVLVERICAIQGVCAIYGHMRLGPKPLMMIECHSFHYTARADNSPIATAVAVQSVLQSLGLTMEASAVSEALQRTLDPVAYLGSNLRPVSEGGSASNAMFIEQLLHHLRYFLEAANCHDVMEPSFSLNAVGDPAPRLSGPMNLIEKIIMQSAVGLSQPFVTAGRMVCVKVDWVLTSELLWGGMEKTYSEMGRPRPHRNDRIWLAVDHTVDPRTAHLPKQKRLMERSEKFRDEAKIINYLPANTSIMHTDFTREKAQPGTIVVGSDSHTCSSGSMGSFAVGFGAADVVMPLVTGQTWFRVPEVCRINFVGKPRHGISGKDVILHVLGLFKRNTIAFQRAVEYGGSGLRALSMDARFAIANMTTEFGGMGACFEADELTFDWISKRRSHQDRKGGLFFRPDSAARYAEVRTIDLADVAFTVAIYPNPDDVVPVLQQVGLELDGCFIGACTTTEQELILGALVLEAGFDAGLKPVSHGKRRVTPGSMIIINRLNKYGLLDVYERAGFEVGAPGCSYCVGINDVDVAQEGEVWLSSQNRNFRNRMGKGSIGNITSAATVAASSFSMRLTDPKPLLDLIRQDRLKLLDSANPRHRSRISISDPQPSNRHPTSPSDNLASKVVQLVPSYPDHSIEGRVQRFGVNIDT